VQISARRVLRPDSQPPAAKRDEWACIEVADQGHGMDKPTLSRAQRPFFSAFTPPGVGLGLETARLAALAHGGQLELDSAKGQGTRVRLLFPLRGGA
jgi:signal transduction histidine kinase